MTSTPEQNKPAGQPAPSVPTPAKPPVKPSILFPALLQMLQETTVAANEIADEVKANRVDAGKLTMDFRKDPNTTDPEIKKYQEDLEKAEQILEERRKKIDEYIKTKLVKVSGMSEEVFNVKKVEYNDHKKAIAATMRLAKDLPGFDPVETFKTVPALKTLAGGTVSTTGTGAARPRLAFISVNGKECFTEKVVNGETVRNYTFTNAALEIAKTAKGVKVSPADLHNAALEAAKVPSLNEVKDVDFSYSIGGKNYAVIVVPAAAVAKAAATDTAKESTVVVPPAGVVKN